MQGSVPSCPYRWAVQTRLIDAVGGQAERTPISSGWSPRRDGVAAFITCQQALLSGGPVGYDTRLSVVIPATGNGRYDPSQVLSARFVENEQPVNL